MPESAVVTRRADPPAPARRRPARSPLTRAVAGVPAGLVLTAVGAGVGLRHLQKTGWSPTTLLGLALLAVGLLVLVRSARALWRSLRGWRRLWLLPVVPLALVLLMSLGIAVVATVVPPTRVGPPPSAVAALDLREVSLSTRDGVRLAAWQGAGTNGSAVVLLHGSGSNRTSTLEHAAVLLRHGYGVLLLDARGHGDSEGRGMDLGWFGDQDVQAALDHLERQPGVDPDRLALVGLSMGGEQAIGAAAADRRIRAVVAEGVTSRTAQDRAAWLPGGVAGTVQRGIDRLTYSLVELLTPAGRPIPLRDAIAGAEQTPFLLITAGEVPDEARAAEVLREAGPSRVQVWTVPGADHAHGLQADPAQWEQRVVGFLDRSLVARTTAARR